MRDEKSPGRVFPCWKRQHKKPGSGTVGKTQFFVCLVLFLVLTCYITLENKNISKIIYNI